MADVRKELAARARALNDRQMQYVLWASVTPEMRQPRTQVEFAELVGVTPQMCNRWAKDPRVIAAIRMLVLANASDPGRISVALDFLFETFQDEEVHMKDRLTAVTRWLDTVGINQTFKQESELVHAQFAQEIDLSGMTVHELQALYDAEQRKQETDDKIKVLGPPDKAPLRVSDLRDD
jgi:hypothetical protein